MLEHQYKLLGIDGQTSVAYQEIQTGTQDGILSLPMKNSFIRLLWQVFVTVKMHNFRFWMSRGWYLWSASHFRFGEVKEGYDWTWALSEESFLRAGVGVQNDVLDLIDGTRNIHRDNSAQLWKNLHLYTLKNIEEAVAEGMESRVWWIDRLEAALVPTSVMLLRIQAYDRGR